MFWSCFILVFVLRAIVHSVSHSAGLLTVISAFELVIHHLVPSLLSKINFQNMLTLCVHELCFLSLRK